LPFSESIGDDDNRIAGMAKNPISLSQYEKNPRSFAY